MFVYILLNLLIFPLIYGNFYENNNTDFSKCKVHYSRSEGSYRVFYEITELSFDTNLTIDLHFSVLALSDAHVLLSTSPFVQKTDPVYEIVLGAGGNTFCDIRRMQKSSVQSSKRIKDLLSGLDPTSFWIHFDIDGLLEIGKEGEEISFLSWRDPVPLPIRYFSFSTWPGVDAKWYFDCPKDRNETAISEDIEPYLTDLDRLRRDLLKGYDRFVRPAFNHYEVTDIDMLFATEYINLDERAGHLEVKGKINMTWSDKKLIWDPELYDDLSSFHIFLDEIWTPPLTLLNAVEPGKELVGRAMMVVRSDGTVNWSPPIELKSWCNIKMINHWPNDNHTCDLTFAFGRKEDLLAITFLILPIVNYNKLWTVINDFAFNNSSKTISYYDTEEIDTVVLQLTIKRESSLYIAVYYTPLLVIATSILATFWVSPNGHLKITLGCLQMVIISIILIALGLFLPVHPEQLPNIISLYSWSMYTVVASIFLSIVVINISRKKHIYNLPHTLTRILTTPSIKCILCIPNTEDTTDYGKSHKYLKKDSTQYNWMLLVSFIDRISFLLFLVFILNVIFLKY